MDRLDNAKNIRDSFCGIKDKLIKQNNLLEAQNFHKAELYCKEIELEKTIALDLKGKAELLLLKLYRKTSEHHTNFIKIFDFTMWIIVVFVGFLLDIEANINNLFISIVLLPICFIVAFRKINSLNMLSIIIFGLLVSAIAFSIFKNEVALILLTVTSFVSLCLLPMCFKVKKGSFFALTCRAILYIAMFAIIVKNPNILNPIFGLVNIQKYTKNLDKELASMSQGEIINIANIVSSGCKVNNVLDAKEIIKSNLEYFNLSAKNNNIKLLKEKRELDNFTQSIFRSLYAVFYLLLMLFVYSLQKTARKNSIIPT